MLLAAVRWLGRVASWLLDPIDGEYGYFDGHPQAEWDEDGRTMRLLADFAYVDPRGRRWWARRGSVIDGASIPQAFWTLIGGPFEGKYRAASIVHDVACVERREPWEEVHRCFYHAMLCGGVEPRKALLMYFAVRTWGPKWSMGPTRCSRAAQLIDTMSRPIPLRGDIEAIERYFDDHAPSIEEVEGLDIERVRRFARRSGEPKCSSQSL